VRLPQTKCARCPKPDPTETAAASSFDADGELIATSDRKPICRRCEPAWARRAEALWAYTSDATLGTPSGDTVKGICHLTWATSARQLRRMTAGAFLGESADAITQPNRSAQPPRKLRPLAATATRMTILLSPLCKNQRLPETFPRFKLRCSSRPEWHDSPNREFTTRRGCDFIKPTQKM